MRFEVLGPLRAVAPVPAGSSETSPEPSLGGPKQRLVLALLLSEPNSTVSLDRLIDGVWGESPPDSARHTLQSYVSELRKSVGDVIERDGTGYVLHIDADRLDALEFESRVSEARARLDVDPATAVAELDAALTLWRGQPFEDFPDQPSLQAEAIRLDELRLAAVEAVVRGRLDLGEHATAVVDLERLTRQYPYREELRALHMLALYRAGRQADALRAFQATRAVLGDELGIDPSPRLRRLEEQILLQDPGLDLAPTVAPAPARSDALFANPYMGLRAFREADAARFFGQDRLVAQLTARVTDGDTAFTAVVGPSGSGKSSAVQAGLLPRLRRDAPDIRIAILQPGSQPFAELEAALGRAGAGEHRSTLSELRAKDSGLLEAAIRLLDGDAARLLLVVDQFEELFTLTDPDEAQSFLAALGRAASEPRQRVHVLLTMRADFYDRPLAIPQFGQLFADNVVNVVPMHPDDLEAAATQPARQLDVEVEPRLVGRLIADVAGQPNALPLFQYALTELFDERAGAVLDLATYERIGGVRKAVARRAESLYSSLDAAEQEAVRQLFLRIATVTGATIGRRRVPASELAALDVDIVALQTAIDAFARYRLLALDRDPTTGAPTVEVAHEALLAEWHRLRDWIEESREDLATHARLVVAVNEWETANRDAGYLLTGSRLEDYETWAATSRLKLTEPERAFIDDAVAAHDADQAHERERDARAARLRRRSRRQLALLFVAVAVLAGIIAYPLVTTDAAPRHVAIALDAPRDADNAFGALFTRAVEDAADEHGLVPRVLEPPYADITETYGELAEDSDLVLGTYVMFEAMTKIAPDHPDTTFVFFDAAAPELPNAVGVEFAQADGSFLVGAAAALESETGRIGYIGANATPLLIEQFRAGFEHGARSARPDIEIVSSLISNDTSGSSGYNDPDRAAEIADWMYAEEGVDVIFTAAGISGAGVIETATELGDSLGHKLWAIGVDTDFLFELPAEQREHLLTSMVKRFDTGIERVVAGYAGGTLVPGATLRLGLAEDGVGYTTSGGHLDATTVARLEELRAEIVRGDLEVETTPRGPARDMPEVPVAPDTSETRAARSVAEQYLTALQNGDVAGAFAMIAPDATVSYFDVDDRTTLHELMLWDAAAGVEYRDVRCTARAPRDGLKIECDYGVVDAIALAADGPVVPETATFTVTDGVITDLHRAVGQPDYGVVWMPFEAWMDAEHPEELADISGFFTSFDDATRRGALLAHYAQQWAHHLEAEGCTFDAPC